jgi:putative FmdB family regulatory protein
LPTYQYACTECGHRFEAVQSFTDATLTECPECQGRLRKSYSSVGVVFKGSGFYRTDSRPEPKDAAKPAAEQPARAGAEAKGADGGSSSREGGSARGESGSSSRESGSSSRGEGGTAGSSSTTNSSDGSKGSGGSGPKNGSGSKNAAAATSAA